MKADNLAILAAAGSRKTEFIVEAAIAAAGSRVLVLTYTNENQRHIAERIVQRAGVVPANVSVMGWFSFLVGQCAKPYQRALIGEPLAIGGLNFKGRRSRYTRKTDRRFYLDRNADMYRDGVADFVWSLNREVGGAVIDRLERIYSHIFIDEVQDLAGYDLDVLDLLLASRVKLTMVGDPRQATLTTNLGPRNRRYRGLGLAEWFRERAENCTQETRAVSYRCNQEICDFADSIYPGFPRTNAIGAIPTGHDGIFRITPTEAESYFRKYNPVVLRDRKDVDTAGLPALNIGVSKGRTYERVMIFPTLPMIRFLSNGDAGALRAPERLYVAVTRARFSVAFVVPGHD